MHKTLLLGFTAGGIWAQAPATGDHWLTILANAGGLGLLALVLWTIHQQTRADAKEDRAEAKREREAERALWVQHLAEYRLEAAKRHETVMAALRESRGRTGA